MKLCMVLRLFPPLVGGPATVASQLSKLLVEHGVEVFVVTQHAKGLPYHEEQDQINIFRVPFLAPPEVSGHNTLGLLSGVLSLALRTVEVTRRYDIRIVEALDVSVAGLAGLVLSSLSNRKFILKYGGDLVFEYLSLKGIRPCNENWSVEESWKVDDFRARLLYRIEKQYVKNYDLLLPDSYYGAELLKKLGAEDEKIRVVPNGVDTQLFSPKRSSAGIERRWGLEGPVVLMAARLVPWKGTSYLVKAAPTILKSIPQTKFLIVGEGQDRAILEKEIEQMGLRGSFIFPGSIAHQEMAEAISSADVFVLPSLFDTTPNVLLEAMSSGKPAVASDISGIREVIRNGETGILVPPGDELSLSEAILKLLSEPRKASAIGKRAREFVTKEYSWTVVAERLVRILEELTE